MDKDSSLNLVTSYKPLNTDLNELLQFDYSVTRTQVCSGIGSSQRSFDDFEELKHKLNARTMLQYSIIKIRFWTGHYVPTGVVNGIQITYQDIDNWTIFETSQKYGRHSLDQNPIDFQINQDELILDAQPRISDVVDQLKFMTSKPRTISVGGDGGDFGSFSIGENHVIIGMHGSTGDCLQSIGFYVAPLREVKYWQKRSYILMKAELTRNKEVQEDIQKVVQGNSSDKQFLSEIAFALLVAKGDQVFAQVMRFV